MTLVSNHNYQIPTMFGTLTTSATGSFVPDFSSFTYSPVGYNPFGVTSPIFYSREFVFNTQGSSDGTITNTAGFCSMPFTIPQFNIPKFQMPVFNYTYTAPTISETENSGMVDTFTRNYSGTLSQQLVQRALSYKGKVNSSAEGNRIFSGHSGKYTAWCADFVTYNIKQTYGSRLPSDFGSSSVSELQKWGKKEGCYLNTRQLNKNERANYIAQNVKPGDIMIEKDGGKSHTGIVTKVYSDGSFDTVEGNTSSESKANRKVDTHRHYPNSTTLSGFVTLDKYSA